MDKEKVIAKIKEILTEAEPYVAGHGGHISFIDYEEDTGRVYVSLQGACANCSLSVITLKFGLEEALKKYLPFIKEVVAV